HRRPPGEKGMSGISQSASQMTETHTPYLSAVIPVYNEEESLGVLHKRLTKVLSSLGKTYEIILVDDGSKDRSAELMRELVAQDPHVVAVILSRNFGHQV